MKRWKMCITLSVILFGLAGCNKTTKIETTRVARDTEKLDIAENADAVTKVTCGSCYKAHFKNAGDIWKVIGNTEPDLFLFMGDNIYSDTLDMDVMRKKYRQLNSVHEYAEFRKKHKILAVWDDHDYGVNDAGEEFPMKKESQQNFLDAFGYAADHPARTREGIYHSYLQGPVGKKLQVINLDTRYHRSPLELGVEQAKSKYGKFYQRKFYKQNTNTGATMLGEEQWKWLENEMQRKSDLCLIVTSIQLLTEGHIYEKWSNIPKERLRMLDLLKRYPDKRVIFLSGDRHLAEISKMSKAESGLSYDLVEMTSSGLTHAGGSKSENKYRVEGSYYRRVNFGTVEIDWSENGAPVVELSIRDRNGKVHSGETVDFK